MLIGWTERRKPKNMIHQYDLNLAVKWRPKRVTGAEDGQSILLLSSSLFSRDEECCGCCVVSAVM
jgi:hypothetical protein